MRRTLTLAAALIALALASAPSASAASLPTGFIGISPQSGPDDSDYQLMEEAGIRSLRLPLSWAQVETAGPYERDWSGFDLEVGLAARYGMRVFPFVSSSPRWVAAEGRQEPSRTAWQRRAWASFLHAAVRRYGAGGAFWRENPLLPYIPVRAWEIWNEENIVTFGTADPGRYASLIRASGRAIHSTDPSARVILGGLFGRPLQIPPNVGSGDFLSRVYRARNVKRFFDGVALHPYVADAGAMRPQIRNLRRIMRVHHDAATPLYITELGWGSASFQSRWERGFLGQAQEMDRAFSMLAANRRAWRIGGVWWFSWADAHGACQFCDSAGLLNEAREGKPSWYRFNAWTGGDPDIVPRARFGDDSGVELSPEPSAPPSEGQ